MRSHEIEHRILGDDLQIVEIVLDPGETVIGGEGLFLTTLSGHGRVWLQSLPFSRLADTILSRSSGKDQGSVLGGLGTIFEE